GLQRDVFPQTVRAIGSDTVSGADSVGVGIRNESAVRFQRILQDTYGVAPGTFDGAATRVPSGNLLAKVTFKPCVNGRIDASHNYPHGNREDLGFRFPNFFNLYSLSSNAVRLPATVNATRLTWTAAGARRLSNELILARFAVRESCRPMRGDPQRQGTRDHGILVAGSRQVLSERFRGLTA